MGFAAVALPLPQCNCLYTAQVAATVPLISLIFIFSEQRFGNAACDTLQV
jgi:hypothetical protein